LHEQRDRGASGVSDQTIKNQLSTTLCQKAGVGSRLELTLFAQQNNL
jgi:DNA-binding NarL/FixJ family response regulator